MRMSTNTFLPGRVHTVFLEANVADDICHLRVYRRPDKKVRLAERVERDNGRELWHQWNKDISSGEFPIDLEANL